MDDSPEVSDLGEYIEDAVTLSGDPKRLIAKKTVNAYTKGIMATAATATLALGAASMGPIPVIAHQQAPVKRPDEHLASQTQETALSVAVKLDALSTGSPTPNFFWSENDAAPVWSGNNAAPFWKARSEMVRRWKMG